MANDTLRRPDSEPIGASPRKRDLADLWKRGTELYQGSRGRILDARDLEDGTLVVVSPEATMGAGDVVKFDPYASRLPQRTLLPLQLEQQISDLMPDILREASSGSEAEDIRAQKVEACLRGALDQQFPWRDSVGKAVRDAEWGAWLYPASAAWEQLDTYLDTLGEDIRRKWWRDASGVRTTDRRKLDRKQSSKAYREALKQAVSARIPTFYRLISATDCVPFFTRGYGKRRWELSALLVRTLYHQEELIADRFRWDGMDRLMIPAGYSDSPRGQQGMVYLYEYAYYDYDEQGQRVPMLAYSVGGLETYNGRLTGRGDDEKVEAVINLKERYGMTRHFMGYYRGLNRAGEDNPDKASIPYLAPYQDMLLGVETMMMSAKKHAYASAFNGQQFVPDPNVPVEAYTEGTDGARTLKEFTLPASGEVVSVPGQFRPVAPAPMGSEARYLLEAQLNQLLANAPDRMQFGGDGANSGNELSVSHALFESANSHIKEGLRQAVEDYCEWSLELWTTLCEQFSLDGIPIVANQPPTADTASTRPVSEPLLFRPSLISSKIGYRVTAFYPKVGNLAERQQMADFYLKGLTTWDDFCESMGINDPFTQRIKVARDKWLESPPGQALVAQLVAQYRGDPETMDALMGEGKVAPDGTTAAEISPEAMQAAQQAVGGMQGGGGPPPTMPGMAVPNVASSALGGTVAGAVGQAAMLANQRSAMQANPMATGVPA